MASFEFACVVGTDVVESGKLREFDDVDDARVHARVLLGRLAADVLQTRDVDMVSVEIFNETKTPVSELRLMFEEIPK
jgi:hypothetical protein